MTSTVTWAPGNTADLIVYDSSSLSVLDKQTGSSQVLTSSINNVPAAHYKIKVHNDGTTPISFTLTVSHC
jgi:hypothetical protein